VEIIKNSAFNCSVCSIKLMNMDTIHLNIVIDSWVFNKR
jgi:hypothetical protein